MRSLRNIMEQCDVGGGVLDAPPGVTPVNTVPPTPIPPRHCEPVRRLARQSVSFVLGRDVIGRGRGPCGGRSFLTAQKGTERRTREGGISISLLKRNGGILAKHMPLACVLNAKTSLDLSLLNDQSGGPAGPPIGRLGGIGPGKFWR